MWEPCYSTSNEFQAHLVKGYLEQFGDMDKHVFSVRDFDNVARLTGMHGSVIRDPRSIRQQLMRPGGSHMHAAVVLIVADDAGDEGKERVVPADADIGAWMEFGAALTHDNAAGIDRLTAKHFHAEALALRVATVAG